MQFWKPAFTILGILPLAFATCMMSFYYKATETLGFYPSYNNPDPKVLSFYDEQSMYLDATLIAWGYSIPVWLLVVVIYLIINRKAIKWSPIIYTSIAQAIGFAVVFSGIVSWYLD